MQHYRSFGPRTPYTSCNCSRAYGKATDELQIRSGGAEPSAHALIAIDIESSMAMLSLQFWIELSCKECAVPAKLLAIWLDAAEVNLLEPMMARGEMPNLRALREQGAYGRLKSRGHTLAETAYGMLLTGQPPEKTGAWNTGRFDPDCYEESDHNQLNYRGVPCFPELCPELRTCIFDIPSLPFLPALNGIQICAWGSHSPRVAPKSNPPELLPELIARYGDHPGAVYHDFACLYDVTAMQDLRQRILTGLSRRGKIACDLLGRDDWDLFFMAIGEPHSAGHLFWPHPDCVELLERSNTLDTMETVYRAIDEQLGQIIAAAGDQARVVVFSGEGMSSNNFDIFNVIFLPELMFRYSFPGCQCFDFESDHGPSPEKQAGIINWVMEVWHQRRRPKPLEKWLHDQLPLPLAMTLTRWLGLQPPLRHPSSSAYWKFQPTTWTIPYRPYSKAFAMVTASDGFIRLNVQGRERNGIVKARDFERTCAEIEELLLDLRIPETGECPVGSIVRIRHDPMECLADHNADLVVLWNSTARDRVISPRFGRFGPSPYHRAASHTTDGFLAARGPGIESGVMPVGSPLDIAATLLELAGSPATSLPSQCRVPYRRRQAA